MGVYVYQCGVFFLCKVMEASEGFLGPFGLKFGSSFVKSFVELLSKVSSFNEMSSKFQVSSKFCQCFVKVLSKVIAF